MADEGWAELGVRPETTGEWQRIGADAFVAALAQGDGYGPSSARHQLGGLRAVAADWRATGLGDADALRWHRAGFAAREAAEWSARGIVLEDAALRAGHRMRG